MTAIRSYRPRPALPHQCARCRRHETMRRVVHPAGEVVLCVHCGAVRHAPSVEPPRLYAV